MIGNLGRPEASDIAIINVTFYGLTKSGGAAGRIDFPTGGERECASHGYVGALGRVLQSDNVILKRVDVFANATGLLI